MKKSVWHLDRSSVECLEIIADVRVSVSSAQRDFKYFVPRRIGAQTRERLLPAPADPDQKRIPTGHPNDAVDTHQVADSVLEQHQCHHLIVNIVVFQN